MSVSLYDRKLMLTWVLSDTTLSKSTSVCSIVFSWRQSDLRIKENIPQAGHYRYPTVQTDSHQMHKFDHLQ